MKIEIEAGGAVLTVNAHESGGYALGHLRIGGAELLIEAIEVLPYCVPNLARDTMYQDRIDTLEREVDAPAFQRSEIDGRPWIVFVFPCDRE